ncbi:MAG TPA: hypothetical protein VFI54_08420 [Solirubrobacteraceae bacterium]|nr:hypothetical protein [Solirubrobacteraceae bacterium]
MVDRVLALVRAIRDGDSATVEAAVLRLSRSRRWLAPLALAVGAVTMLFEGLRLVCTNLRLMLIQIVPAMWIWLAMLDLKAHALHGRTFHVFRGPIVIPLVLLVAAITAACYFLNAVFAFSIANPGKPEIRPGLEEAKRHRRVVLAAGFFMGLLLGFSTIIVTRWGHPWFALSLGIVVGLMMVSYVSLPARLIGAKRVGSRRDKLVASAVGGLLGAVVSAPGYTLGRIGILMLGVRGLVVIGVILLAIGFAFQAGATGAIKAIKFSTSLIAGRLPAASEAALGSSTSTR